MTGVLKSAFMVFVTMTHAAFAALRDILPGTETFPDCELRSHMHRSAMFHVMCRR